jgi:hypothetical protein
MDDEGLIELFSVGSTIPPTFEIWKLTTEGRALARLWDTRTRNVFVRIFQWSVSRLPTLVYDLAKIAAGVLLGWYLRKFFG